MSEHTALHPIRAAAATAKAAFKDVRDVQPVFMSPADQEAAVRELAALEAMVAEARLRVVVAAQDTASRSGARDLGAWLSTLTLTDFNHGRADARLAEALDRRWAKVADGMADGAVSAGQAQVIVHALDVLPADLDPELLTKAEQQLVDYCKDFRPRDLRRLGRRILEIVAPDIAEAEEAKRLEDEERRAREKCRLVLKPIGDGTTRLTGLLPDLDAHRLRTYLDAFTSPRKAEHAAGGEEDRIPYPRRLGHAFCALLEHLDPKNLPVHGGDTTTLLVTIPLESLKKDLGTGTVVGGEPMSASAVRRLACTANIIPVVLGGQSEVLDLGRTRRLFSPAQRKAMRWRDQHCRAEGCTIPAGWCEAHHLDPWANGGKTDLDRGALLCSWHHHRAHDPTHTTEHLPNGDIRFHRRP
ncbi:HNH endonuclease [Nocardioides silvaticus]|uniref:HNH endonuclease n=1 Tax=Nocardioides silvaticus TaxID=2201891 RepID=A0A316TFY6_9ACTN|nr:HNH endonuclease signature motif containing protein [Nocardioides silvaticus]PWN03407.1 HNH endonuclease [Nocardioides silvaticus]